MLLNDKSAKYAIVRNAACDALVEMTGLTQNGRDADLWNDWLRTEAGPKQDNLHFRDHLMDLLKRREQPMPAETMDLLERLYQQIPTEKRAAAVNNMLADPEPGARVVGVRLFEDGRDAGRLAASLPLVSNMIGDSSPAVRQQVAHSLGVLNQKETAEALMTQLALETEPAVKVEIVYALATEMGDLRVVPQLLQLLKDPSSRVRVAAAGAVRTLGPAIKRDPALMQQVIGALKEFIQNNAGDLKAAGVEALVPLADPSLLQVFTDILNPKTSRTRPLPPGVPRCTGSKCWATPTWSIRCCRCSTPTRTKVSGWRP